MSKEVFNLEHQNVKNNIALHRLQIENSRIQIELSETKQRLAVMELHHDNATEKSFLLEKINHYFN